jgi:Holliday junction DNA helicase RuvB
VTSFADLAARIAGCGRDTSGETETTITPGNTAPAAPPAHRPATWDDYVGQARVKRRLQVAIGSALARDHRAEHILLTSGPGQGKTTLAQLIATEMGRPLVILTKPPKPETLRRACEAAEYGVLFVDEIHAWGRDVQEMLMELTESGTLDTDFGVESYPFITVVAATTDPDKLLKPLVDRFGCKLTLDPYTDEDMVHIARGMVARCWPAGIDPLDDSTCAVLATASASVPRDLRSLVMAGRDLALIGEIPSAEEILILCDTDPDGCTRAHLDILERLDRSPKGTAGLATLSTALRVPVDMIRRTERLLLDRDFVALTPSGRTITPEGRARLGAGSIRDAA